MFGGTAALYSNGWSWMLPSPKYLAGFLFLARCAVSLPQHALLLLCARVLGWGQGLALTTDTQICTILLQNICSFEEGTPKHPRAWVKLRPGKAELVEELLLQYVKCLKQDISWSGRPASMRVGTRNLGSLLGGFKTSNRCPIRAQWHP